MTSTVSLQCWCETMTPEFCPAHGNHEVIEYNPSTGVITYYENLVKKSTTGKGTQGGKNGKISNNTRVLGGVPQGGMMKKLPIIREFTGIKNFTQCWCVTIGKTLCPVHGNVDIVDCDHVSGLITYGYLSIKNAFTGTKPDID